MFQLFVHGALFANKIEPRGAMAQSGKCVPMLDRFGKGRSRVNIGQFSWSTQAVLWGL